MVGGRDRCGMRRPFPHNRSGMKRCQYLTHGFKKSNSVYHYIIQYVQVLYIHWTVRFAKTQRKVKNKEAIANLVLDSG